MLYKLILAAILTGVVISFVLVFKLVLIKALFQKVQESCKDYSLDQFSLNKSLHDLNCFRLEY